MWFEFASLEEFNTWHDALCLELGIPDGVTLAYTHAYEVDGKFIAVVEEQYSEGLTPTDLRIPATERL